MGYAGMDYDTFANTRLRDVPFEVFESIRTDCLNCGADMQNTIIASLLVPKKVQNCGAKAIWKVTVSLFSRVVNPPFTATNVAAMN